MTAAPDNQVVRQWPALWALCLGFFMILVDSTIVSVATPAIMTGLHTDINGAVWVTSAYLLAYAVPLLITGRLGDQFGPKNVYLLGLVVFTGASVWCGLTGSIDGLIIARVFQGLGAALITPQTMTVITRVFPAAQRGTAMGVWGAVAGVATLVGPVLGGVLVDALGWEWIFFINLPVGIIALAVAWKWVPSLPTHSHRFDIAGIVLSGAGLFCLVFGIQEGQKYDWGSGVWALIGAGLAIIAAFLWWQSRNRNEPLLPLNLFRDRNFSLANIGISSMGFAIIAMALPLMLYAQTVLRLTPTRSALLLVPLAVLTGVLAPPVGKLVDRVHPRYIAGFGYAALIVALVWLGAEMTPGVAIWRLLLPISLMGVANACIWSPVSATATRNLPMHQAGAGSGVYNTARQLGAVLGSAAIGVLMQSRLSATVHSAPETAQFRDGYASAMGQSLLLPAAVLVVGFVAVVFFAAPVRTPVPDRAEELAVAG